MTMEYSKLDDEYNADLAIEKLKNDYGDFPKKAQNFWKLIQTIDIIFGTAPVWMREKR